MTFSAGDTAVRAAPETTEQNQESPRAMEGERGTESWSAIPWPGPDAEQGALMREIVLRALI